MSERPLVVVTTQQGVRIAAGRGSLQIADRSWRWTELESAAWSEDDQQLTIVTLGAGGEAGEHLRIELTDDPTTLTPLLSLIRERLTASVVLERRFDCPQGGGVVVARRDPDEPQLRWSVTFDEAGESRPPEVLRAAAAALREAQHEVP